MTKSSEVSKTYIINDTGLAGEYHSLNLTDGSIKYFKAPIAHTFTSILVDNIGTGSVKISFNAPFFIIDSTTTNAKTLKPNDTLSISDNIEHIGIYYIANSTIEFILITE
jgi:hypothetical protein